MPTPREIAADRCPTDVQEYGQRNGLPEFARATWQAGFIDGYHFAEQRGNDAALTDQEQAILDAHLDKEYPQTGGVDCPRAKSDMTPCVLRDGERAADDRGYCVGCGERTLQTGGGDAAYITTISLPEQNDAPGVRGPHGRPLVYRDGVLDEAPEETGGSDALPDPCQRPGCGPNFCRGDPDCSRDAQTGSGDAGERASYEGAIAIANKVLDRINADPDDDLATLARQFLRAIERKRDSHREGSGDAGERADAHLLQERAALRRTAEKSPAFGLGYTAGDLDRFISVCERSSYREGAEAMRADCDKLAERYADNPPSGDNNNTAEAFAQGMDHRAGAVDCALCIRDAIRALPIPGKTDATRSC